MFVRSNAELSLVFSCPFSYFRSIYGNFWLTCGHYIYFSVTLDWFLIVIPIKSTCDQTSWYTIGIIIDLKLVFLSGVLHALKACRVIRWRKMGSWGKETLLNCILNSQLLEGINFSIHLRIGSQTKNVFKSRIPSKISITLKSTLHLWSKSVLRHWVWKYWLLGCHKNIWDF